jgi:hypothetical protein
MPEHVSCLNSFCCNLLLASMRSMRGSFYTRGRVEIGCVNGEQMIKPVVEHGHRKESVSPGGRGDCRAMRKVCHTLERHGHV